MRGALILAGALAIAVPGRTAAPDLGEKIVAFCEQHKGEMVGNGECATLAGQALKAAGAKSRGPDAPDKGDYVWGELVLTLEHDTTGAKVSGKRDAVRPGDVIQFRDAKFAGKKPGGKGTYTMTFPHHTAVVRAVEAGGSAIHIYQQNVGGKKVVLEATLRLNDLTQGWIRVYHPVADGPRE
jgi:hypothetical protein